MSRYRSRSRSSYGLAIIEVLHGWVFPGLAIDTLHVAVVPLMVIEADGVAACTDVACAVAEQDNNRINARMREIVFFFINTPPFSILLSIRTEKGGAFWTP